MVVIREGCSLELETMTVKEVAGYLRVHTDMIYALVRQKQIPHVRLGNRILFTKETIHSWIQDLESMSLQSKA